MITVSDVSLSFGGQNLFTHVNLKFTGGNCYGVIGANGAGKSTFLKILAGELEPSTGEVAIDPKTRMSVLKQDQNAYNAYNVMDTVIMGNQRLYDIGKEKEALYAKEEMTEADGIRACELEEEYAELGGWEAESDASRILQGLGVGTEFHSNDMATLDARLKVKVLLAQALFGKPDEMDCDTITVDDYAPVYSSVRCLISSGRRRIGIVAGMETDPIAAQRLKGYTDALKNAHFALEPALISHGEYSTESGYERAKQLLSLPEPPDALLVSDNLTTVGALMAVMERGLKVPRQLAIIGFDNVMLSQSLTPKLSVIVHPTEKMAAVAAQTLLDQLSAGGKNPIQSLRLPSEFMMGDSL